MLQQRHLLGLEGYPAEDIQTIIETAFKFREVLERPIKKVPSLQGVTIVNLFFENSTRTRISFELAQKRLSAETINFSSSSSSLKKGESFTPERMTISQIVTTQIKLSKPHFFVTLTHLCASKNFNFPPLKSQSDREHVYLPFWRNVQLPSAIYAPPCGPSEPRSLAAGIDRPAGPKTSVQSPR